MSEYTEIGRQFFDQLARQGRTVIDQGSGRAAAGGLKLAEPNHLREGPLPGVFDEAVRGLARR